MYRASKRSRVRLFNPEINLLLLAGLQLEREGQLKKLLRPRDNRHFFKRRNVQWFVIWSCLPLLIEKGNVPNHNDNTKMTNVSKTIQHTVQLP